MMIRPAIRSRTDGRVGFHRERASRRAAGSSSVPTNQPNGVWVLENYWLPGLVPPGQPLPAPFSEWAPGFRDGLASLGWEPEWLAGGHAGVAPFSDLLLHVGD